MLDSRAEGLGFNQWPGHGDYIYGQGSSISHMCVPIQGGVYMGTETHRGGKTTPGLHPDQGS